MGDVILVGVPPRDDIDSIRAERDALQVQLAEARRERDAMKQANGSLGQSLRITLSRLDAYERELRREVVPVEERDAAIRERDELRDHMARHFPAPGSQLGDMTALEEAKDDAAAFRAEADSLAASLAAMTAERDALQAELKREMVVVENLYQKQWQAEEAERIAAWLDERSKHHDIRHDQATDAYLRDEHGWASSYATGWAQDIRQGAHRTKGGES